MLLIHCDKYYQQASARVEGIINQDYLQHMYYLEAHFAFGLGTIIIY